MPNELTADESRDLRTLAGYIIPASVAYGVPGADDDLIFSDILKSLERDFDDVRRALAELRTISGGAFAGLPGERRVSAANALKETTWRADTLR